MEFKLKGSGAQNPNFYFYRYFRMTFFVNYALNTISHVVNRF